LLHTLLLKFNRYAIHIEYITNNDRMFMERINHICWSHHSPSQPISYPQYWLETDALQFDLPNLLNLHYVAQSLYSIHNHSIISAINNYRILELLDW